MRRLGRIIRPVEAVYPILFLLFKGFFLLGTLGCMVVIPLTAYQWVKVILEKDTAEELQSSHKVDNQI